MGLNHSPKIVKNSITGCFDAENPKLGTGEILDLVHQQPVDGNEIKMIFTNAPYSSTTPKYYTFDGLFTTGAVVQSYPNFVSNPTDDFTLEIMLRPTNLTGQHAILGWNDSLVEYTFLFNNNQLGIYRLDINNIILFSTPSVLTTNKWYHIVFTKSSSTLAAYCNDIYQGIVSGSYIYGDYGMWTICGDPMQFYDPFVGNFAFFRSYSKILSAAEVQQNFNATRGRFGI